MLYDEERQEVIAEGHTIPCDWDGTPDGLGDGIDAMLAAAFIARADGRSATALCALAAEVRPRFQGGGLASRMLDAMTEIARDSGLDELIAPVRPCFKDRYPITPIEEYVAWTREDGELFDPWIRIHTRRGEQIVKPIPHSMRITGTIAEWEEWTGMSFPGDGHYTFAAGLAPVEIDHKHDRGSYWEPNVWIVHAALLIQTAKPCCASTAGTTKQTFAGRDPSDLLLAKPEGPSRDPYIGKLRVPHAALSALVPAKLTPADFRFSPSAGTSGSEGLASPFGEDAGRRVRATEVSRCLSSPRVVTTPRTIGGRQRNARALRYTLGRRGLDRPRFRGHGFGLGIGL